MSSTSSPLPFPADDAATIDAAIDLAREILRYMNEQSISHDYHRYGNLGRRSDESRRSPT